MSDPTPPSAAPTPEGPQVWLSRLTIHKFRNVAPTTLTFSKSFNVLLGINASGKTTLLELLSACLRGELTTYRNEEFDLEFELQATRGRIVVRTQNRHLKEQDSESTQALGMSDSIPTLASAQIDVYDRQGLSVLSFRLPSVGPLRDAQGNEVSVEKILIKSPTDSGFLRIPLLRMFDAQTTNGAESIVVGQFAVWLTYVRHILRFDESLLFMDAISGPREGVRREQAPGFRLELAIDAKTRALRQAHGVQLADQIIDPIFLHQKLPPDGNITIKSSELPFLHAFVKATGFSKAELLLAPLSERAAGSQHLILLTPLRFRFYLDNSDSYISEGLLSYGQKRLLSFLYYVACNEHCVIADELVNGLHHAWITVCLDAIGQRQAFLTSQNPLLLDYLGPGSEQEAQERFIQCKLEERDGAKVMVWKNLEPEVAAVFYRDYRTGHMQVSELLRVHGLW